MSVPPAPPTSRARAVLLTLAAAGVLSAGPAGCAREPLRVEAGTVTHPTRPSPTSAGPTQPALPPSALANIRNVDLRSTILADPRTPAELRDAVLSCTVCGIGSPIYGDLTGDGADDVLVPIYDENAAAGTLVYSVQGGAVKLVFAHVGHQGFVDVTGAAAGLDIVLTRSMYAAADARCCPSGPPEVSRYSWRDGAFVLVQRTGGGVGHTPYDPKDRVLL